MKTMKLFAICVLLIFVTTACMFIPGNPSHVQGSGKTTSETRDATGATSVSLEGSANVDIVFGDSESAVVTGDDNIVPLIETKVQNHKLTIKTKDNANFTTSNPLTVKITLKSLDGVAISGSGNLDVPQYNGDKLTVGLPGSGNITLGGSANTVNIVLSGSGNIHSDKLTAKSATAMLSGSGSITVNASEQLDATVSGSGDIRYSGSPAKLTKIVTGSGNIHD